MKFLMQLQKRLEKYKGNIIVDSAADVGKFVLMYLVLAMCTAGLFAVYVYFIFEVQKIDLEEIYDFDNFLPTTDYDKIDRDLALIVEWMYVIPTCLASFAVFFSVPPKPFKRIAITAFILLLINIPLVYGYELKVAAEYMAAMSMFVMIPWLLSLYVHQKSKE